MPQPFPSQLMVGFVATYVGGELKVDADELEDGMRQTVARLKAAAEA